MIRPHASRLAIAAALGITLAGPATAQTLRIGLSSEPTAIDPHYHELGPNNALRSHIFDALTVADKEQKIGPRLAVSWSNRDDNTWVFKLREGVTFTNGHKFTADDVIFTYCRVLFNETSVAGSFTDGVKNFAKVEKEGDHTVVITTKSPDPLLLSEVSGIGILPRMLVKTDALRFDPANGCGVAGGWPTVSQFNDGSAAIGTGPYRLKSYTKGAAIELVRNEGHWGPKPHWAEVRLAAIPAAGPRLAGLLAGDLDLIENPGSRDLPRIRENPRLRHVVTPSTRVIYLQLDQRDNPPFVQAGGANPLKDQRVRLALSKAIDRKAIVDRLMDGAAAPAFQFLPTGMFGTLPDPAVLDHDVAGARKLLTDAGYPNGFALTLHATNDRYINDGQIAQAVAQYWTRIGVKTELDAMSRTIFFGRRAKAEFSVAMGGWGSTSGEASSFLRQWVATTNREAGVGGSNYGNWSDPAFDKIIMEAIRTIDAEKRAGLLRDAGRITMAKLPYIPLHFESTIWAFRAEVAYAGRADQFTLATEVTPVR